MHAAVSCLYSVIERLQPPVWDEQQAHIFRHADISHPRSDIYEKVASTAVNGRAMKYGIL